MTYEMIGETIKSAVSIKLGELFKTPVMNGNQQVIQNGQPAYNYPIRYKENITNPQYPNFHIIQVNCNVTQMQERVESAFNTDLVRLKLDYLINIQYRLVNDTETITTLRRQLDEVGFKLLTQFTDITLDKIVYAKNCRYEIVDGVLQFFCNFTVYATTKQVNDTEMEDLELTEDLIIDDTTNISNEEDTQNENNKEEEE